MLYVNTIVISLRVVEIIENIIDTILNFYLYNLIFSLLHKDLRFESSAKALSAILADLPGHESQQLNIQNKS